MNRFFRSAVLAFAISATAIVLLAACASASTGDPVGASDPFTREEAVTNSFVTDHGAPTIVWVQATDDNNADYVASVNPGAEIINLARLNDLLKQSPEAPLAMIAKTGGENLIAFSAGEGGKTVDRDSLVVQSTAACIAGLIVRGDLNDRHIVTQQQDVDAMHQAITIGLHVTDVPTVERYFDLALAGRTDCQHLSTDEV